MTTTHTQEELRRWCELAGLRFDSEQTVRIEDDVQPLTLHVSSPLLLPYVAELLVGKAMEKGTPADFRIALWEQLHNKGREHPGMRFKWDIYAGDLERVTPAQRCRAAEEVLGER